MTNSEEKPPVQLERALGPYTAIAIVVGSVIGSGVFFKPGTIANAAGNFPLIISVWVLGGVLCMLGGVCFAELASMFPQAGGQYVYLRETYGRLTAFLFGWSEVLLAKPAGIGALSVAFTSRMDVLYGGGLSDLAKIGIATGVITGLAIVNILGVAWGGRMQLAMTIVKAGSVAGIALLPFLLMPFQTTIQIENYASTAPAEQQTLGLKIGAVLLAVMWAYHGWHGVTPLAEEIRDPQRNVPLGLIGGIGIVMILYVSANIAYHGMLSMAELQAAGDQGAEQTLKKLIGPIGQSTMAVILLCSTFGAMNSNILETPRVAFAMGRDGVFFRDLGKVHATLRTPVPAIIVTAAMSVGILVAVAIGKWCVQGVDPATLNLPELAGKIISGLKKNTVFDLLTNFVVFASAIFQLLVVLAVFILRWKRPDVPRPYKTFGYPFSPAIFLVIFVWFMIQIYKGSPAEANTGILLIGLGIPGLLGLRTLVTVVCPA